MSDAATITSVETVAEPTGRLRAIAAYTGYGLFFLIALLVALVLTFPNRQLKGFVESQARKAGYPVAIERMALTGLGGVTFEGVKLTLPQPKGKDGKPTKTAPTIVRLDKLTASVALWPLIRRGEVDADFGLVVGDGAIEGGHVVVKQGATIAGSERKRGKKPTTSRKTKKAKGDKDTKADVADKAGATGRKATLIDLEIPTIDHLDLAKLGISGRVLGFTDKVTGELQGTLSGSVSLHWEGTHEGARGNIDLELTDAVLHNPGVAIDPKGPPLQLKDLRLGVVTVKVRIDEKGRINLLKSKRGVDSSTAVHLAGVDIFGKDLELVAEERGHIIIPPGRSGMAQARLQVHLVFALPKASDEGAKSGKKTAKAGAGKSAGADDEADGSGRASWNMVREMMNGKFKRFMRSGYLGITCAGSLSRPVCAPSLPQVTVGTRKQARSEARAKAKADGGSKAKQAAAKLEKQKATLAAAAKLAEEAKQKAADAQKTAEKPAEKSVEGKKVKFEPAVRPGAQTAPVPRTGDEAKRGVKVQQRNEKKSGDQGDEEDEEEAEQPLEGDEGDEDDETQAKRKAAADKKKALAKKKKDRAAGDEDGDEPEEAEERE